MLMPSLPFRVLWAVVLDALLLTGAYPAIFVLTHGLARQGWPKLHPDPVEWGTAWAHLDLFTLASTLLDLLRGHAETLHYGGLPIGWGLAALLVFVPYLVVIRGTLVPARDTSKRYGDARFALPGDIKRMNCGLELGRDPATGRAARVLVEGNLLTIAPPRSGKSSGLILPNLVLSEVGAWGGPAVVIDPKGDVFQTVQRRRRALGRTVHCLDPLGLVGGTARWNPLLHIAARDTLALLSLGRALLPDPGNGAEGGQYFRDRASVLIAAAMLTTIRDGAADASAAAALVRDPGALASRLEGKSDQLSVDALGILQLDPRSRDPLLSTAGQALQFLLDEHLAAVMSDHTLDLADLTRGETDLFIVAPADERREILAPYLRWLLSDLFNTVRRNRPVERIVVIVDEAFVLGRFDAILKGVGELPGYGVSLWTFWQSRAQMIETYGTAGADVLLDTAEVVNLFNTARVRPDEAEYWSRAIGSFTGVQVSSSPGASGRNVETRTPVEQRLVPPGELNRLTRTQSVCFLSGSAHTPDPLLLDKTRPFDEPRFAGLLDPVEPVGRLRA